MESRPYESTRTEVRDGPVVIQILRRLRDELLLLIRQEIALARTETEEKLRRLGRHAVVMGAGAVIALVGAFLISQAVAAGAAVLLTVIGLEAEIAAWLGPAAVGVILGVVGYAVFAGAKKQISDEGLMPEETLESLRRDKAWAQEKLKRHDDHN
jgi:hypothetical protein